ncbi:uncharacterized protein LOC117647705 [Thrips palmi]|uniref:Uncharacterized protein LOC117647705 n=1 Tax=Thrips palmi TaxID=161013 RepID=A0A6P8YZ92_THRPL|nr:uncharacterized protein LOC117647705 [Thrips palmi]
MNFTALPFFKSLVMLVLVSGLKARVFGRFLKRSADTSQLFCDNSVVIMKVILEVEGRKKALQVAGSTVPDLRKSFNSMCGKDPVLSRRIVTHYPTFSSYNGEAMTDLELENDDTVVEGQLVKVFFAAYAAIAHSEEELQGLKSTSIETNSSINADQDDIMFMDSIGMRHSSSNTTSIHKAGNRSAAAGPSKTLSGKSSSIKKISSKRPISPVASADLSDDNDEESEYWKDAEARRKTRSAALKEFSISNQLAIKQVQLKPKRQPQKKKEGVENREPSRKQPLRAVRSRMPAESVGEIDLSDLDETEDPNTELDFEEPTTADKSHSGHILNTFSAHSLHILNDSPLKIFILV